MTDSSLTRQDRLLGLFRLGWAVQTHFVNFDLVPDLDWERTVNAAIPDVEQAESVLEYYRTLQRLVAKLRDGHTNVALPREIASMFGRPPVEVEWVQDQPVITSVGPTVSDAGLKPGALILEISGRHARDVLDEISLETSASTEHGLRARACMRLLNGPNDEPARVVIKGEKGSRELGLVRSLRGIPGLLPMSPVEVQQSGNVACIAINTFNVEEVVSQFDRALDASMDAKGVVLDLRRNTGGNGAYARQVAARLTDRPLSFERSRTRQTLSVFEARGWRQMFLEIEPDLHPPRDRPFLGPLAILIGPMTWSAAEDFLVGLHGAGRATLFGQPTHGSTGQPLWVTLPGGGGAGICTRRCLYPDGREFVGRGIQPDIAVSPTIAGLRAGRDEVLDAALQWLAERLGPDRVACTRFPDDCR